MNGKVASMLFLVVCLAIMVLSLSGVIAPLVAGGIFAACTGVLRRVLPRI